MRRHWSFIDAAAQKDIEAHTKVISSRLAESEAVHHSRIKVQTENYSSLAADRMSVPVLVESEALATIDKSRPSCH
jgi:hypothetical protein